MPKYRSKAVEIEAVRWTGDWQKVKAFCGGMVAFPCMAPGAPLTLFTPEGEEPVEAGEWIIRGSMGGYCKLKDSVFTRKYEKVEE